MFICKYCGKEVGNNGCLVLHEKRCIKNPNRIISKTQAYKEDKDSRRDEYGKIKRIGHKHTEETKQRISKSHKKWLSEHKDEHIWRRDSKFLSKPCENLKEYLKEHNISFVEEYEPFDDVHYCLDIAWPDEKIAIEVNGNQHYDRNGNLSKYYLKRHKLFEDRGWKVFEVHYSKCYYIKIKDFEDILKLPIYDKDYVGKYLSKKLERKQKQLEYKENQRKKKEEKENKERQIIQNLIENSGIDFSKSTWSKQSIEYLKSRNELWNKMIFRCIRKYYPEFLKQENVWKRKGSKY